MSSNIPQYIVVHTAAHSNANGVYDTTVAEIDRWHKANGWRGIGYHYVIRFDGSIEQGRDEADAGAHVKGLNTRSVGICMSGDADKKLWTNEQLQSLKRLVMRIMDRYPAITIDDVIGHREASDIPGTPHVAKTCPGALIDMDNVRQCMGAYRVLWMTATKRSEWNE